MNKTAIITGASRGIGRSVAERLAREGYNVCINYRERGDLASELCEKLREQGLSAMTFQADVSDRAAVNAMVDKVHEVFGPVTALVNNAGIAGYSLFQDITDEEWKKYFSVNLDGAFHTIQAVLPDMLHAHSGSIVNISSIWGLRGASCEVTYSCTKGALIALTRSLAMELAPSQIRVNCVAPGVINTDMVKVLAPETVSDLISSTPIGRLGTPEEIAAAVSYFVSDDASFVTGQVLTADGGFIL
ncbi:MAG: glucose 1-dehydrogenase [Oscillospiraceae bacterium]|nr:glucose 1-dehydrogenase [Oscillospiraceae bacterium]